MNGWSHVSMYVIVVTQIHQRMKEGEEEDCQTFTCVRGILLKVLHKNFCMFRG